MIEEYIRHPEAKSLGPDGKPCTAETRGLLQRAHITAGRIRYIDKETSSMWAQGDDLSVVTDNDETGFRVIEYGKGRKVMLPDSVKHEMREMGLRELRRRGIGQHTIEKALYGQVRVNSYRKILAAMEESKKERALRLRILRLPNKEVIRCRTKTLSERKSGKKYTEPNAWLVAVSCGESGRSQSTRPRLSRSGTRQR